MAGTGQGLSTRTAQALAQCGAALGALTGWRRRVILFALGGCATLALPPVGAWPILYPLFWALSHIADGSARQAGWRGRRSSFGVGWWFAFGYFALGWYWIANALLVFSDRLWWMVPFAALGLPAVMAVYYGLAALAVRPLKAGLPRALGLAMAFVMADWLRGHLFTGFPWNVWGYAWADSAWLSQGAALVGVYGLGAIALTSAALVAAGDRLSPRAGAAVLVGGLLLPLAVGGYGALRLNDAPDIWGGSQASGSAPGLRIVQAGIPQREKWPRRFAQRNFERHMRLSQEDRPPWVRTIIWPETAAAFFIEQAEPARLAIADMLPTGGWLLSGAPRHAGTPKRLRNALVAIDDTGVVAAHYDKHHLVPFGEYVPLKGLLPFAKVTEGASDYAPGPGPQTLNLRGLPAFSPLICYEVIFPGAVVSQAAPPAWLLNLTNDAWYGQTAGPHQHLQHARLRALEQGLPMVRAANTGITAVFDGWGRTVAALPLGESGYLDVRLPRPLVATPLYAKAGEWLFFILLLAGCIGIIGAHLRCGDRARLRPRVETNA